MLGYDRMGRKILPMIEALTKNFAVVDYDPNVIEELTEKGVTAIYGDAGSEDLLKFVRADKAKLLISTIPAMAVNEDITDYLKRRHSQATVILTVKFSQDAARCYGLGATFVIVPSVMGGELFAQILKRVKTTKTKWGSLGKKELEALEL
jgi:Trk K+ transport system NAD-binding subunit